MHLEQKELLEVAKAILSVSIRSSEETLSPYIAKVQPFAQTELYLALLLDAQEEMFWSSYVCQEVITF